MPYTLWSRNRLIGSSELAYRRSFPKLRVGDFEPTELGEKLMPIIVGVGPALSALYEVSQRVRREQRKKGIRRSRRADWPPEVKETTEYADAMSLPDELESLALELRDPSGTVVETESIWLQDTHRLVALAREELAEVYPDMEFEDEREPWEPEPPRYQIYVELPGHDKWMSRAAKRREM
jgi:hypothetical protein